MGQGEWPQNVNQADNQDNEEAPESVALDAQILAAEDDAALPPLEELIQATDIPIEPTIPEVAEHILAMDDLTDESQEDLQMPPLIDDNKVEMPAFPNLQNQIPMQVEEVPLDELIAFDALAPNQALQASPPYVFEGLNLGFVHTFNTQWIQ